ADASAVQFTRQTSGLTGALKKIGGLEAGSQLGSPKTENISHMLFGEGVNRRGRHHRRSWFNPFSALYATHPPLIKRIRALEPDSPPSTPDERRDRWRSQPPDGLEEDARMGFGDAGVQQAAQHRPTAREYAAAVGNPTAASYGAGARIRKE